MDLYEVKTTGEVSPFSEVVRGLEHACSSLESVLGKSWGEGSQSEVPVSSLEGVRSAISSVSSSLEQLLGHVLEGSPLEAMSSSGLDAVELKTGLAPHDLSQLDFIKSSLSDSNSAMTDLSKIPGASISPKLVGQLHESLTQVHGTVSGAVEKMVDSEGVPFPSDEG